MLLIGCDKSEPLVKRYSITMRALRSQPFVVCIKNEVFFFHGGSAQRIIFSFSRRKILHACASLGVVQIILLSILCDSSSRSLLSDLHVVDYLINLVKSFLEIFIFSTQWNAWGSFNLRECLIHSLISSVVLCLRTNHPMWG